MSSPVSATFVFTDLVDSTATAARLGPEAADALRQTHFRLLRGAVSASAGTEVKNLGDGLMVMYSSPSRALAGAAGMQQAIEHHNRSGAEPLGVRIGVSTGEAVEEDGDYFGDPVVEAARLCAAAQGGQILAADLVRLMVGRHATQTFVEVGPLELKGLPEPVAAVDVLWEPVSATGGVPLPGRLVGAATDALFGFFGRGEELDAFAEARKQAQATQRCQAVFVAGEAGMGKTAVVAQAARAAHEQGAVVVFGHADEDLGVAYQPWIEIVTDLVRHGAPETVAGLRSAQRGALAKLVPEIGADAERVGDPDTERLLLLQGTVELLAAESGRAPLVVVLDDLHWADTASLQLLRHLIGSTTPTNVTIACTYRDTDLGRGDALTNLLSDLHREGNITRLGLRGLDDIDVVELMAAAAGHDLDDAGVGLAHALRRETDGNPFFSREILRHLGESGRIVLGDDGRWTVDDDLDVLGLPNSVRDVVGRRVERLGDEARRVLMLAAVIGREFDPDLLVTLVEVDEDRLLDLLDAAVGAAILVESETACRYRFAHALIQHSLYDDLSPARRQRAHQRIAAALEEQTDGRDAARLAELARHWVAATRPSDLDKALSYVRQAGDAARDALAPDDAIRWYQQALDLLAQQPTQDERQRAELLVALGLVQRITGRPEYRTTMLDAFASAERLDDDQLVTDAALGLVWNMGTTVGDAEANAVVAAALQRLPSAPTAARARLLAALCETFDATTQADERRAAALEALDTARRTGDDATFLDVINIAWTCVETPDRRDETIADLEAAVTMAERIGDPVRRAKLPYRLIWTCYQRADLAGADQLIGELEVLAEELGLPQFDWEFHLLTTGRLLLAGDADAAEASNNRILEVGTAAEFPEALGVYGGFLHAICQHRGRPDEIAEFFIDAARDNPSIAALRSGVIAMLCDLDRLDEARERLSAEAAAEFDYPYDTQWVVSMVNLIDGAVTTGDRDSARLLVARVRPYADHVISPSGVVALGAVARPLARAATLLGDYDQAEEWFAIAHDIHERLEAPFWIARGQLDHADLCLARRADGDVERARELATTAAATAAEYGCGGLTERAAALLTGA